MRYETLKAKEFMGQGEEITILKIVTSGHCGLHDHDFIEFGYVELGKGYHIVGNEGYHIKSGDFFIINANIPHEYKSDQGTPITLYNCIFHPSSIDSSLNKCSDFVDVAYRYLFHSFYSEDDPKNYIKFSGSGHSEIRRLFKNMYHEYTTKENGYKQILKSDLIKLLILSFRIYKKDSAQTQSPPVLKRLVAQSAVQYLKEHYSSNITLEKLAERAYLSPSYFSRLFKQETGMTALQMLQKIRIERACQLLRSTDLPISQIAEQVGYLDGKFFYKLFQKETGTTPGKYRTANLG